MVFILQNIIKIIRKLRNFENDEKNHRYNNIIAHLALPEIFPFDKEIEQVVVDKIENIYNIKKFALQVHKNDTMFNYHLFEFYGNIEKALLSHFNVGLNITLNLSEIFKDRDIRARSILDFGSGYGRISRFLHYLPGTPSITISEIKSEAVRFQKEFLGVDGIHHSSVSHDFPEIGFDVIIAISVFTHLPLHQFQDWFERLCRAINYGGYFIFTYNDLQSHEKIRRDSCSNKLSINFYYNNQSEERILSFIQNSLNNEKEYGNAYVEKIFIENLAKKNNVECHFIGNELAPNQSAVIIHKT